MKIIMNMCISSVFGPNSKPCNCKVHTHRGHVSQGLAVPAFTRMNGSTEYNGCIQQANGMQKEKKELVVVRKDKARETISFISKRISIENESCLEL